MRRNLTIAAFGVGIAAFLYSLGVVWWFILAAAVCGVLVAVAIRRFGDEETKL
jgi:predicted branched-subunit amino acid permease